MIEPQTDKLVPNPLINYRRNAPCICGSGRKFKVCHLPHLSRMVPPELAAQGKALLEKFSRVRGAK